MFNPLNLISKIIKSPNQKELDKTHKIVEKVNQFEMDVKNLKNEEFPKKTEILIEKIKNGI